MNWFGIVSLSSLIMVFIFTLESIQLIYKFLFCYIWRENEPPICVRVILKSGERISFFDVSFLYTFLIFDSIK